MDIYQVVVNFNENTRDYVSATLYHNNNFYKLLDDIVKPENVEDYTVQWKNGLIDYYKNIAGSLLPDNALIVTLWKDVLTW